MLTRDELRAYCMKLTGTVEEFPFGPEAAVYKVMNKMFALIPVDASPHSISLKCDPQKALMLRDNYEAITGGYHLNKRHWNTISIDGEVPDGLIYEMIEDSYDLVVAKLTKKQRDELASME